MDNPPNWSKLAHAAGSAELLPATVDRLLAGGATANSAWAALKQALLPRQVGRDAPGAFTASGPAFSLLVERSVDPRLQPIRGAMMTLLLTMLQLGDRSFLLARGVDRSTPEVAERFSREEAAGVLAAATACAPVFRAALSHANTSVKRRAVTMLGYLPDAAQESLDPIAAFIAAESVAELRARGLYALAYLGIARTALRPQLLERVEAIASGDPITRGARDIARWALGVPMDLAAGAESVAGLLEATFPLIQKEKYGSNQERALDRQTLALLSALPDGNPRITAHAIVQALRRIDPTPGWRVRRHWPDYALAQVMPEPSDPGAYRDNPLDPTKLTADEREVLEALQAVGHEATHYGAWGLPPEIRSRRRFLGLDPPGALEEAIQPRNLGKKGNENLVCWQAMHLARDKYRALPNAKRGTPRAFFERVFPGLSSERWLELVTEAEAEAYGLSRYGADEVRGALEAATTEERKAWRERYRKECVQPQGDALRERLGWVVALEALEGVEPDASLPEAYEPLMDVVGFPAGLRAVYSRIAPPRRLELLTCSFMAHAPDGGTRATWLIEHLLDLAPGLTSAIIERHGKNPSWVQSVLESRRQELPEVDAILRDWEKRQSLDSPAPPRPKPQAPAPTPAGIDLTLQNKRTPDQGADLEAIEQKQLTACGRRYDGRRWGAKRRLKPTDKPEEGNFYGHGLEIWDVILNGEHRYDLWLYMVDSGLMFEKGTTKVVLSRVQFDFSAGGGDPLLAAVIQQAVDGRAKAS